MYKYQCLNPIAQIGLDKFGPGYEKTENTSEADCILVRSAAMHDMEIPSNVVAVGRAGAGVNNIPVERLASEGVVVFNTPGANANGVKEMVLAGMLLASRDIIGGAEWVRDNADDAAIGKTAEKAKKNFAGTEIQGKTLGVIGLGAIGVKVANAAVNLGMEVLGYDPYLSVNAAWNLSRHVKHVFNAEDIYAQCDFITIHVPLLDSTKGMIDADAIGKMKDNVILLNFARDLLVDEKAVVDAIEAGKVRKYVSDFANPTTAGKKGCIVTPHLGASTEESEDNCAMMAVEELKDYLENGNIRNSVNYPACDMGVCMDAGRIAVMHKNVANLITQFTALLGAKGINISNMTNKSKGEIAYTLIDVEHNPDAETIAKFAEVEGVFRVRVVK